MHRHHQHVVGGVEAQQVSGNERSALKIEGYAGSGEGATPRFLLSHFNGDRLEVSDLYIHRQVRLDLLDGDTFFEPEGGPETFVAADDLVDGPFDLLRIDRFAEAPDDWKIVERVFGFQLLEEPDALLCARER